MKIDLRTMADSLGSDLNGDGVVDIGDFNLFLERVGAEALANEIEPESEPTQALTASEEPQSATGLVVTEADAAVLLDEAAARWSAVVGSEAIDAALAGGSIEIADLGGLRLAEVEAGTIRLDWTAAGHGWYVDATPEDDVGFHRSGDPTRLVAAGGSPASEGIDLLSVLIHEIGHLLGFDDAPAETDDEIALEPFLAPGERVLPPAGEATGSERRGDPMLGELGLRDLLFTVPLRWLWIDLGALWPRDW